MVNERQPQQDFQKFSQDENHEAENIRVRTLMTIGGTISLIAGTMWASTGINENLPQVTLMGGVLGTIGIGSILTAFKAKEVL